MGSRKKKLIEKLFAIDTRSLALFRVSLALIAIYDVLARIPDLKAHYTDWGVLPRGPLLEKFSGELLFSLNLANGTFAFQLILSILTFAAAIGLLLGYRTRLMTFVCWILEYSFQCRNLLVLTCGDFLFRDLLFFSLFVPLGAAYSIDSTSSKSKESPRFIFSAGTVALLIQTVVLYMFLVINKNGDDWWKNGTAVHFALMINQMVTPFGKIMRELPNAWLTFTTYSVLLAQAIGPVLMFSPFYTVPLRLFWIVVFIICQVGFGLGLYLGTFPYIASAPMFLFLPTEFWDSLRERGWRLGHYLESGFKRLGQHIRPGNARLKSPWYEQVICSLLLASVIALNFEGLDHFKYKEKVSNLSLPAKWVGLFQPWHMFSPSPMKADGWFIAPGVLRNGDQWDIIWDKPYSFDPPPNIATLYYNNHWQRYYFALMQSENTDKLLYFGQYLCRRWNESHPVEKQVVKFQFIYMETLNFPTFQADFPKPRVYWNHVCFITDHIQKLGESRETKEKIARLSR